MASVKPVEQTGASIKKPPPTTTQTPAVAITSGEPKEFHLMSLEELRRRFNIDLSTGHSSAEAANLLKKHGKNQVRISYARLAKSIVADLFDYLSIMLWLTLVLSVISYKPLGNPPQISNLITAFVLFASLLAKSFLAALQTFNSIRSLRGFQTGNDATVHVLRDSSCKLVACTDLVLGDVVYLMPGKRVPAALRLVETHGLVLDKSALTGETDYVEASALKCNVDNMVPCYEANNMALPNCLVVHGEGVGVLVALSTDTQFGFGGLKPPPTAKTSSSWLKSNKRARYSPHGGVVEELGRFVLFVLLISLVGVLIYLVVFFAYIQRAYAPTALSTASDVVQILVSGIPFGVPVAVTCALFIVSRRLKQRNILVKDVFAIDSLSSVDVIITDKTGTLTRNELRVCNVLQATKEVDPDLCYYNPVVYMGVDVAVKELLMLCYFCKSKMSINDTVDSALYTFYKKNMKFEGVSSAYKDIDEVMFTSSSKYSVKLVMPRNFDVHFKIFGYSNTLTRNTAKMGVLMARGAPELLLKKCSHILEPDGSESELTEGRLRMVQEKLINWSFRGRRVVALCRAFVDLSEVPMGRGRLAAWFKEPHNRRLCFVGLVGFVDPPKQDIHESIGDIRKLGVRVVMATGDYSITAASIAKQVGILSSDRYDSLKKLRQAKSRAAGGSTHSGGGGGGGGGGGVNKSILLNGTEIDSLTPDEWSLVCREYAEIVLSRATPQHKLRCVQEFQSCGMSVLMAGDGANDVPALKAANLSVAMGSGNRFAADIADIVLLDNNFTFIPELVNTGKQTFVSLKKIFLFFTVVSTFTQSCATLIYAITGIPNPFSVYAGTIMCVVTDGLPAVTFIFEKLIVKDKKGQDILSLYNKKEKLVDWRLFVMGCVSRGPLATIMIYANYAIYLRMYTQYTLTDLLYSSRVELANLSFVSTIQSISFYTAVCVQSFGNLWAIRSSNVSVFKLSPFTGPARNLPMCVSAVLVYAIAIVLINLPVVRTVLGFTPIPYLFYILPFVYALFMIALNEIRLLIAHKLNWNKRAFIC